MNTQIHHLSLFNLHNTAFSSVSGYSIFWKVKTPQILFLQTFPYPSCFFVQSFILLHLSHSKFESLPLGMPWIAVHVQICLCESSFSFKHEFVPFFGFQILGFCVVVFIGFGLFQLHCCINNHKFCSFLWCRFFSWRNRLKDCVCVYWLWYSYALKLWFWRTRLVWVGA